MLSPKSSRHAHQTSTNNGVVIDAMAALAVQEAAGLQCVLVAAHGARALDDVGRRLVQLGCEPSMVGLYCAALAALVEARSEPRDARRLLLEFCDAVAASAGADALR